MALFIMLISFISCEKEGVNGETSQPTEVAKGTVSATVAYTGVTTGNWMKFYVCDISQLDVITTMITQMHNTYMSGNMRGGVNIYDSFVPNLPILYTIGTDDYRFSYGIKPGTYVLMAERYVQYSFPKASIATDNYIPTVSSRVLQYKIIKIESNQTISVSFIFQDYVSDAVDVYW